MKSLYSHNKLRRTRPSFNGILSALYSVVACYSRTFIIINALDEGRGIFLREIFSIQAKARMNIFAKSRFN